LAPLTDPLGSVIRIKLYSVRVCEAGSMA
jgi:hypothetical protein